MAKTLLRQGDGSKPLKNPELQLNYGKTRAYNLNVSNHVRVTGVNITKKPDNTRKLTIGRSVKCKLYWDAIKCLETKDPDQIAHVKGMQSLILSIEKMGMRVAFRKKCYSKCIIMALKF